MNFSSKQSKSDIDQDYEIRIFYFCCCTITTYSIHPVNDTFFVIDRSQWHFLAGLAINFCHWLQSMTDVHKFGVIDWSQWHMAISSSNIGDSNCHWPVNDSFFLYFLWYSSKTVIGRSMSVSKGAHYRRVSAESVIDQSMTLFELATS